MVKAEWGRYITVNHIFHKLPGRPNMKLKTYTAQTMAQALAQVRKDLGSDAMILHTRSFRTGSWLGFGGKPMVEITASTPQPSSPRQSRRAKRSTTMSPVASSSNDRSELVAASDEVQPDIVVQRSRVAQRVSGTPTEKPASREYMVDDRAALLQGLMGGVGARDRQGNHETVQEPIKKITINSIEAEPIEDEGFEPMTFRTIQAGLTETPKQTPERVPDPVHKPAIEPVFEQKTAPAAVVETDEPTHSKLLPHGNLPVFELAMTPFVEEPAPRKPEPSLDQLEAELYETKAEVVEVVEIKPASSSVETPSETQALQAQIEQLQKMMGKVLDTTRRTAVAVNKTSPSGPLPAVEMSAPLHAFYSEMIDNDVPLDLAERFVGAVRDRLDADELNDRTVVRHALLREIESSIQTVSESLLTKAPAHTPGTQHRPHVLALIGPTGVGKTTTVAKLAATAKLRHGKRVALITSDTYRIAAIEQLKTYASIIGLELRIANSPEEISSQIDSLRDIDLVVIDTAGRSQNNHARLDELGALIAAARPDETHLVLSSTVGDNVLRKTAERFMSLGPDRCILTKIDEAVTTGMIAGMSERIGLPLSFVTVGQEVPDDILPARADRLARAVLDGPGAVVPGSVDPGSNVPST